MKKLRPWLVLLLVFCAGTMFGIVATRIVTRRVIHRMITHPDFVRERIQRELVRKLKLTPGQEIQVEAVLTDSQKELRDLRQEFQPRFVFIIADAQNRISAVLTPDQRERFEKLKEQNRHYFPSGPVSADKPRATGTN
ncbi:MAG TPA: hypothetical protein VG754_04000 [Verrucomicrobiae bacterium]|nr:hypothetical protein [Verrucomicrobiae bacterium]